MEILDGDEEMMRMAHPWRGNLEPEACDLHSATRGLAQNDINTIDVLTARIIQCIITVHQTLGPGFRESVYRNAMKIELARCGLATEVEKLVVIRYIGCEVGRHRLDMVVEDAVILEMKAVEQLGRSHYAQVRSYLKATGLRLALLVNFATERADFRRIESP